MDTGRERHLLDARLRSQEIARSRSKTAGGSPHDVVSRLGAMQAQDYLGALWAIGLRSAKASQADVERAIADRQLVRTWPMRGTLHFVASEDVRWMLDLMAPRIVERGVGRDRQLGLDADTFSRAGRIMSSALAGGAVLTRKELLEQLETSGISIEGQRGYHILGHHALTGLICLGPMRGRQQTFVLLDEWVPSTPSLDRDEALARVAERYFAGHGPATLEDLARWTGLTRADARAGLHAASARLERTTVEGVEYWSGEEVDSAKSRSTKAKGMTQLLPGFDEYVIGYANRRLILGRHFDEFSASIGSNGIVSPTVLVDGRIVGTWRRVLKKAAVEIAITGFEPLAAHYEALADAADRYGRFLGLRAEVSL